MGNKIKPWGYWTKDMILADAKKYQTRGQWKVSSGHAYTKARQNGWLEDAARHMVPVCKPDGYWTKERLLADARQYKHYSEWEKNSASACTIAARDGLLSECTAHMTRKQNPNSASDADIIAEARKFKTKTDWKKRGIHYQTALRRPLVYDKAVRHMPKISATSTVEKELLVEVRKVFQSARGRRFRIKNEPRNFDLDIWVPESSNAIEVDGDFYHSVKGLKRGRPSWGESELQNYHNLKDAYFKRMGISVMHISVTSFVDNRDATLKSALAWVADGIKQPNRGRDMIGIYASFPIKVWE